MRTALAILLVFSSLALAADKPRVAVFPLAGDAPADLRDRAAFSLRTKLDRTGGFEVVDGPKMAEIVSETNSIVTLSSKPEEVRPLAQLVNADILLWGEIANEKMTVNILDLRAVDAVPQTLSEPVIKPTDLRFAVEKALEQIEGVATFSRPVDERVWDDDTSQKLWRDGPNLLVNGDFSAPGHWSGVYRAELYEAPVRDDLPPIDKVAIVRGGGGEAANGAIALHLSVEAAETNGLAALSDAVAIKPNTRYRLQYRYKSDGPKVYIFVKGYTRYTAPTGEVRERETYRRQAPLLEATDGKWVTITDDFNPQHVTLPIETLRVDLYTYRFPGTVYFDDVVLKEVGPQTRTAKDAAIKPTTTRPRQ